jgi:protein tyrosine phosphatase (PTP) superfamily phosphohydrolase (DUF442 family)
VVDDPADIVAWQRIDARLTTSGRLTAADLDRLAALGVTRVINLALADSPGILPHEDVQVAERGMAYVAIPVPFDAPAEAHYARFRAAMAQAQGERVHVHCAMNWRVSAFLYRWHREHGMADADARALLERQWSPETHGHKDAPTWARFVAGAQD